MKFPTRRLLDHMRSFYQEGTRVELIKMDDPQAPPNGTRGTVRGVDDAGNIMVAWDNGCGLNIAYGEDVCSKLDTVKITYHGKTKVWDTKKEAAQYFFQAICDAEDEDESDRCIKIYAELVLGKDECSDEDE